MTGDVALPGPRQTRGDRQREAIVSAVRDLLLSKTVGELSVSIISERAGIARSGFYFYFESKYSVLAVMLADMLAELDVLTHDFAPREPGEAPADFARRMMGIGAGVFASNDPVVRACTQARNSDDQIRQMMDDSADTVIDKLITLVGHDPEARPITPICLRWCASWWQPPH